MVEQNARRCLQICDRGYVLDQGRDAYTGTGRELLNDPKVIELYLGTLGEDAAVGARRNARPARSAPDPPQTIRTATNEEGPDRCRGPSASASATC